jgi:lipoyl-dependent peroxiredoxin
MMRRRAHAVWSGAGQDGKGQVSTGSGALKDQAYSTHTRFVDEEGRAGTNPEELIAAAHAGCFSMALAYQLSGAGHPPAELATEAVLEMHKDDSGWTIRSIHLKVRGKVDGMDADSFRDYAEKAKAGCPVSRVLNADISLTAELA